MANIRKTFAQNLKDIRKSKGLSQEQLAERLDISVRYVQQLEGTRCPNVKLDTIANLSRALRVRPADLIK